VPSTRLVNLSHLSKRVLVVRHVLHARHGPEQTLTTPASLPDTERGCQGNAASVFVSIFLLPHLSVAAKRSRGYERFGDTHRSERQEEVALARFFHANALENFLETCYHLLGVCPLTGIPHWNTSCVCKKHWLMSMTQIAKQNRDILWT